MKIEDQLMQLHERSDYAREVLGRMPSWLLRWGSSVIFGAVIIAGVIAWMVKYPDIVPAEITLITEQPPVRVVARASGKLKILVDSAASVKKGDPIALIENTVAWESVKALQTWLAAVGDFRRGDLPQEVKLLVLDLGELHPQFAVFQQHFETYRYLLKQQPDVRRRMALMAEREQLQALLERQQAELETLGEEMKLAEASLQRSQKLKERKLVSAEVHDNKQAEVLRVEKEKRRQVAMIATTEVDLSEVDKNLVSTQLQHDEMLLKEGLLADVAYQQLLSDLGRWQQEYLLRAPIDGHVSWSAYWSDYQHVKQGDDVFAVVPATADKIIGKVSLPMQNSGKVKLGQDVYIKLYGFPYQEFGILKGRVMRIALIPDERNYRIEVELPQQLETSFNRRLPFRQEMLGQADIVTEDLRLLQRVYYQLLAAIERSS